MPKLTRTGAELWNVCHRVEESGKTHWPKIGVAFLAPGEKLTIKITSIPINFDGTLYAFPANSEEGGVQLGLASSSSERDVDTRDAYGTDRDPDEPPF